MEAENRAIFQSPPAMAMPSFYNNYPNYAGYGFMHPHSYYSYPSWSPMLSTSAPPSSPAPMPAPMMLSPSPFQQHKFGWFGPSPIPVATSTPLMNPAFVCSTSSMMDVQKETGELSVSGEVENEQSLTEEMWVTTAVGNTRMNLRNSWTSNSMEDQSNPHPMFYSPPFGHSTPYQFPVPPYSTGHLPMPIYPQITKDIKQEISEDAKDGNGIWRDCLVCGDKNFKCGKNRGLQVCLCCRQFFKRMVESDNDKTDTFECSQVSQGSGNCLINKDTRRNLCQFCRYQACLKAGMDRQKIVDLKAKREKKKGSGNDNLEEVVIGNGCK